MKRRESRRGEREREREERKEKRGSTNRRRKGEIKQKSSDHEYH